MLHLPRRPLLAAPAAWLLTPPAAWLSTPGAFAADLTATMTEGPLYPDRIPIDTDNDLLVINDSITPAVGEITYLDGRVTNAGGGPIAGAHVEIWQCDHQGIYMHGRDSRHNDRDGNFQSYGRFITGRDGRYGFRTIRPVRYAGRTPHIHIAVSKNGHRILTTQLLIAGEPQNQQDSLFKQLTPDQRPTVLAKFLRQPDANPVQWQVTHDLILGRTANETHLNAASGQG